MKPQLLIGAINSASGKTLLAVGLLRMLKHRGLQAQPFKCGPDYIDPQYHVAASGREAVNLDTWLASKQHIQQIYNQYAEDADACIAEGMMGLFDGYRRTQGSSAEIAKLLNLPVVLVVNARSLAYSAAPTLYGFKHFHAAPRIIGVIFSQVTSASHYAFLKEACADAGLECLGYLPADESLRMPSKYMALTQAAKQEMDELAERAAALVEKHIEVDKLLNLCIRPFPCPYRLPYVQDMQADCVRQTEPRLQIAVARDAAFNFIYHENLDRLREVGKITFFSPLYSKGLPKADMVYLPGGYPELFARQLHRRKAMMEQLRNYAESGGKIWAEGGAITLLSRSITTQRGTTYEMANILPLTCTLENARLYAGYRTTEYNGTSLRGHEYHYSALSTPDVLPAVSQLYNVRGNKVGTPLYRYKNVIAGYTHWYWGETDILKLWE